MSTATKIGSVVPSHLVGAVTDHLPDHLPSLPDRLPDMPSLSINVGDVTDRLRHVSDSAASKMGVGKKRKPTMAGRLTLPAVLVALGLGLFVFLRSRRSTPAVSSGAPAPSMAA